MGLKYDLHVHTHYSKCSWLSLKSLIKTAQERNIHGIAVTDHNTTKGALRLLQQNPPFRVIVGEEIDTQSGQIIGYFLQKEIGSGLSIQKTIDLIKDQNGLVAVPHPFDRLRRCRLKKQALYQYIDQIDIIEVYNGRTFMADTVQKSANLAVKYNKPTIAGSDAHSRFEIGTAYTELEEDFVDQRDFLDKLRGAKLSDGTASFWCYPLSGLAKILHYVKAL